MTTVIYDAQAINVTEEETLLQTLLNAGYLIPNSCHAGACQSCLMQAIEGEPPPEAQQGLKATQQKSGYFLACQCFPVADMTVALPGKSDRYSTQVSNIMHISGDVLRLRLKAIAGFNYRAGQFVNLIRDDGLTRSYSLASVPAIDEALEFHIRILPNGPFSQWADEALFDGDSLEIQGPLGECFYAGGDPQQPLLMACTGTGLAPLYGIVRDALQQGHQGEIHLYAGSPDLAGLYLVQELQALAAQYPQFHYHPVVLETGDARTSTPDGLQVGDLNALIKSAHPDLKGFGVYLCGSESRVNSLRKQCFLSGAATKDIHYDLFTPAAS